MLDNYYSIEKEKNPLLPANANLHSPKSNSFYSLQDNRPNKAISLKPNTTYLTDNRPATITQQKTIQLMSNGVSFLSNKVVQLGKMFSTTAKKYQGKGTSAKRAPGDAAFLAQVRFAGKKADYKKPWITLRKTVEIQKGIKFSDWIGKMALGTLREAQHLVPVSIARQWNWPDEWVNSFENGMMLLSGRAIPGFSNKRNTNYSPGYITGKMSRGKTAYKRILHVGFKNRIAHPDYDKTVTTTATKLGLPAQAAWTHAEAIQLMNELRTMHKANKPGIDHVDQL